MSVRRRQLISSLAVVASVLFQDPAAAQHETFQTIVVDSMAANQSADWVSAERRASPIREDEGGGIRTRQAILLTGVAVSMLAYGFFVLRFNNRRTDAENARIAYQADVRQNAQRYVDQGVQLDQIPTYFAWERAFTDAANQRELVAVAGLSAFLLGLAAILDSATAGNEGATTQAVRFTPVLDVSPVSRDIRLGARIGL